MSGARPLHEVFLRRALDVGWILRHATSYMDGFRTDEKLSVELEEGDSPTLKYIRPDHDSHHSHVINFENISPTGASYVVLGDETITKTETIGSTEQVVDNRHGVAPIEVNLRDLFGHETEHSSESSQGVSEETKITISASESVEGVASFDESVEQTVSSEFSETQSSSESTSREEEGSESTTVPAGKRVRITETRARADGTIPVTARGDFTHTVHIGKTDHGHIKWGHRWESWQQFKDVVTGNAPDNWPLASYFKEHPLAEKERGWSLADLNVPLRYEVKFEGRVMRSYKVEEF